MDLLTPGFVVPTDDEIMVASPDSLFSDEQHELDNQDIVVFTSDD